VEESLKEEQTAKYAFIVISKSITMPIKSPVLFREAGAQEDVNTENHRRTLK
jgi:hypothetical protein